jgi:hypothetical protein
MLCGSQSTDRFIVALSVPLPHLSLPQLPTLRVRKVFRLLFKWNLLAQTFLKALQLSMVGEQQQKHLLIVQA